MGCGASQATRGAAVSEPVNPPVKPVRPAPIRVEEVRSRDETCWRRAAPGAPARPVADPCTPPDLAAAQSPRSAKDGPASSSAKLPSSSSSVSHGPKTHRSQDTATPHGDLKEVAFSEVCHRARRAPSAQPLWCLSVLSCTSHTAPARWTHGQLLGPTLPECPWPPCPRLAGSTPAQGI
jgi:hypothetical protein